MTFNKKDEEATTLKPLFALKHGQEFVSMIVRRLFVALRHVEGGKLIMEIIGYKDSRFR